MTDIAQLENEAGAGQPSAFYVRSIELQLRLSIKLKV
jgi:hypothetical protein